MNCKSCGKTLDEGARFCDHCGASTASGDPGDDETLMRAAAIRTDDVLEGKWKIQRRLGQGGMGAVYLAHDLTLDRKVAVKLLSPELCNDPQFIARFEREAKLTANLEHPNIVGVHAVGRHRGRPFIVMAFLDGVTLSESLRRRKGGLGAHEVVSLMRQICAGLGFIHSKGFVHRDIKPSNLFVGPDGHATVLDLGILREVRGGGTTRTGLVMGTPHYMSPEQALGIRDVDHRSDLYSLGVVLFEMVTGVRPFESDSEMSIVQMHAHSPPPEVTSAAPWAPIPVAAVVRRALAKKPDERYPSAGELSAALEAAYAGDGAAKGSGRDRSGPVATVPPVPEFPHSGSAKQTVPLGRRSDPNHAAVASRGATGPGAGAASPQGPTEDGPGGAPAGRLGDPAGSAPVGMAAKDGRRKKVLIVDDSDVALEAAQIVLEEAGLDVVTLDNPLVIVNTIRKESPDLILVDVNMPMLTGDQLVEIAGRHGVTGGIPVVLHSDLPLPELEKRVKSSGAAGYIQKTSNERRFLDQVRSWLALARS